MKASQIGATLALAAAFALPAAADAPPDRGIRSGTRDVSAGSHRWAGRSHARHAGHRHHGFRTYSGPGPAYGPRYYPGYGNASSNAGFGALAPAPVAVTLYREAYIGRGLIYNTPPEPHWRSSTVISVKY